jgi:hypothetical protein
MHLPQSGRRGAHDLVLAAGRGRRRRGAIAVSSTLVAVIVVVLVLVAGIGYYLFSSGTQLTPASTPSGTPTGTTQTPAFNVTQAYLAHLAAFGNRTTCTFSATCVYSYAVLNDYNNQSAITWRGGNSSYIVAGTYSGMFKIQSFYQDVTQATATMTFRVTSIKATGDQLRVIMGVNGVGVYLGKYSGTVNASATYTYSGGAWSISKEVWTYTNLNAQNTAGYQPYVSNYASG